MFVIVSMKIIHERHSMNIDNYRVFLHAVRTKNLTAAAEQLGYTQSGVSHIIAQLEREFGFPLLIRSKSGITLTQDGERMLAPIRDVVNRDEQLHQLADEIKGLRSGRLRVGAFSSVATQWLPQIIKGFNKIYPNIEFDVSVGTYRAIEDMITGEEIECGFMTCVTGKNMHFIPLKQDRLLALLPDEHPLSEFPSLPLGAIEGLDFIIPGEGSNYDVGQILKTAHIKPKVRFSVSDDYAAIAMVKEGLGMTIMPELIIAGASNVSRAMELDPPCTRTIGLATRPNMNISPACKAFIDYVSAWAERSFE